MNGSTKFYDSTAGRIFMQAHINYIKQLGLPGVRFLTGQSGFLAICPVKNILADLENCTKFDQLILNKIIKIVATSCQISRLKCT